MQDRFIEKNAGRHRSEALRRMRRCPASLGLLSLFGALGCGANYRPVVAAINPVGPAGQPAKYAVAVSSPQASGNNGLLTIVDFSGDSILATPQVVPLGTDLNPNLVTTLPNGSQAFVVNSQGSLSDVPDTESPGALITSLVVQTTLPAGANAPSVSAFTLGSSPRILVPEIGRSAVAVLSTASPALQQEIAVSAHPVYVVGTDSTPRAYVISNGNGTGTGQVAAIEASSINGFSVSATIPVGIDPVYGVETTDTRRAFILNKGSGTVSVINVINNAPDSASPLIPATGTLGQNPIWADLSTVTNELVVLNQGDGTNPGSLSIINIPLCNPLAQANNPSCNAANPVDAAGFGTVVATVPVGVNPSMVSVLADGSRAYVVNSGNATNSGSVSVVNLVSGLVTATIPAVSGTAATPLNSPTSILGHPNTVAATTGTPTGKVYVTSSDSQYMTVIETDTDMVDTQINLQGLGVRVHVTAP